MTGIKLGHISESIVIEGIEKLRIDSTAGAVNAVKRPFLKAWCSIRSQKDQGLIDGREANIALTHIEDACMHAVKGFAMKHWPIGLSSKNGVVTFNKDVEQIPDPIELTFLVDDDASTPVDDSEPTEVVEKKIDAVASSVVTSHSTMDNEGLDGPNSDVVHSVES
uniref:Uncharacterized protein n=1 Tax=viral metagenome TaxID=1070528 RepID=A0A2V0RAC6_9ZZZZ